MSLDQDRRSFFIRKLESEKLLPENKHVLDLGPGLGDDIAFLANRGYEVDCVDKNPDVIANIQSKNLKINCVIQDLAHFKIEKEKYGLIIASNSLPFLPEKEKVDTVIQRMIDGLSKKGVMYLTLFGMHDEWQGKRIMSFFTEQEALGILAKSRVKIYWKNIEEGYGRTMNGSIKYWHIFKFICIKE